MAAQHKHPPPTSTDYFLSLGAGSFQLPLLEAAHRLGMRTIAVDRNLQAPGMAGTDLQIQSDITRSDYIIRQIQEHLHNGRLLGVATRSFGQASLSAARVARHFGLPHNPVDHLSRLYHKKNYKNFLKERGVPVPRSFDLQQDKQRQALATHQGAVLVRPADGHAKLGLQLLEDQSAIQQFLTRLDQADQAPQDLLIEEMIAGQEFTVMGLVENGRYQTVLITEKMTSRKAPLFAEMQHTYPPRMDSATQDFLSVTMQRIVEASHILQGPIVAEFLQPHDQVRFGQKLYLVECAPETGGEYLADRLIPEIFPEADYFCDLVRLACDQSINYQDYRAQPIQIALRFILQQDGILRALEPALAQKQKRDVFFWQQLKRAGEPTSTSRGNLDRLAVFGYRRGREDPALAQAGGQSNAFQQSIEYIVKNTRIQYES